MRLQPSQAAALIALHDHPDFPNRPCADPLAWDVPEPALHWREQDRNDRAQQFKLRVNACQHCPVLTECRALLDAYRASGDKVHGVMAGTIHDIRNGRIEVAS